MEKPLANFKNPESYNELSVEYPPNPPLGQIKRKDFELFRDGEKVEGQEYVDHLYNFIEKRYGIKKEDLYHKAKEFIHYPEEFSLELMIFYLEGLPTLEILNRFDMEKYESLDSYIVSSYIAMNFSSLVKEIAKKSKLVYKKQNLINPESKKSKEIIHEIENLTKIKVYDFFDFERKLLPNPYPNKHEKSEETIFQIDNFYKALYAWVILGKSQREISEDMFGGHIESESIKSAFSVCLSEKFKNRIRELKGYKILNK